MTTNIDPTARPFVRQRGFDRRMTLHHLARDRNHRDAFALGPRL